MYTEMSTRQNDDKMASVTKNTVAGDPSLPQAWDTEAVVVTADNRELLIQRLKELQAIINGDPSLRLVDIAATLNTKLESQACRIGLVASTLGDLAKRIERALLRLSDDACQLINDAAGIYYSSEPLYLSGSMAFLFPGEGAQYLSMLGDLSTHFPEVDACLQLADEGFAKHDPNARGISEFVHFPKDADPREVAAAQEDLGQLDATMVSVLFADWSMNELLRSLHLRPVVVAGHSAGELAALGAANAINVEGQAGSVVGLMQALRNHTAGDGQRFELLAVAASREVVGATIQKVMPRIPKGSELHLAMDNCPHQTVMVGTPEAMRAVVDELTTAKVMHEKLPFDRPYHTYLFEPCLQELADRFAEIPFQAPAVPVYSCTTARPFPDNPDEIRDLALSHWASQVRFTDMIRQMHADGVRIFVEAGPRGNLSSFAADILRGEEFLAVASNVQRRSGMTQLNHMVAQLAAHHVPMRLDHMYERRDCKVIAWPETSPPTRQAAVKANHEAESRIADQTLRSATTQSAPTTTKPVSVKPSVQPARSPAQPPLEASPAPRGTGRVMNRYLSVMEQFLSDQESVTKAYLNERRGGGRRFHRGSMAASKRIRQTTLKQTVQTGRSVPDPVATPHGPLIGEITSHDPGKSLVMRRRLDLQEELYAGEHTVGGRDVSKIDPSHHGLPVMPMTFTLEMMAEVASILVPGYVVIAICDIQLQRWLAFDEMDVSIVEVDAKVLNEPAPTSEPNGAKLVRMQVRDCGSALDPSSEGADAAAGTVVMAPQYPVAPELKAAPLTDAHLPRPTLEQVYKSLFHGPLFQGVQSLDTCGENGIDASIRVLPRQGLFRSNDNPRFVFDPVFIDVSMHPTVAWHLEQPDQSGRILLPYEMKRIEFFGPCPAPGSSFLNRSRVAHASARQFHQDGEIIAADGKPWCRLIGVRSWRFYLPYGEVNFNGPKDEYFLTKDWPQAMPGSVESLAADDEPTAFGGLDAPQRVENWCVRFEPSPDLMQPSLQGAAAQVTLSRQERQVFRELRASSAERSRWLFGRVAAKDAARILWRLHHEDRLFPADIEIDCDDLGRYRASPCAARRPSDFPNVSFAATDGFMVAAAAMGVPVGVAIEACGDGAEENSLDQAIEDAMATATDAQADLAPRLLAAREAVAQALGTKVVRDPRQVTIVRWDSNGNIYVTLDAQACTVYPEFLGKRIMVRTVRCKDMIIATTLGQCEAPQP